MSTTPIPPRTARIAVSFMFFANGALLSSWASRIPTVQQHLQKKRPIYVRNREKSAHDLSSLTKP